MTDNNLPQVAVPPASTEGTRPVTPPPQPSFAKLRLPTTPLKANTESRRLDKKDDLHRGTMGRQFIKSVSTGLFCDIMNEELPGEDFSAERAREREAFANREMTFERVGDRSFDKKGPNSYHSEDDLYAVFCEPVQAIFDYVAEVRGMPRHEIKLTAYHPESDSTDGRKVDGSVYKSSNSLAYRLSESTMKSSRITDSRKPLLGRVSYTYIDLPLELKIKCAHGAFEFKDEDDEGNPIFIRQDDLAKEDRGQVAEYISEIFERQPRQKLFTLFVHRDTVQLLVTDRTSTRISRPLNYVQHSDTLATFFFRFADTDDQGRGYDPTVVAPAGYEIEKMKETLDTLEAGYVKNLVQDAMQDGLECSVSPPSRAPMWPIRKVAVLHERKEASADGAEKDVTPLAREARHLLVGKPQFCSHDAHGRGTKGFVAYDLQEGGFVYLKESWRLDSPTVHPEWKTYERLQANGVEHVGTMLCGGDVLDPDTGSVQRTTNQRYGNGRFTARIHTRLVLKQIGRRLEDYKEAKELCRILLGGLLGHQQAWEKALILHRDISDGNILIVGENPDSVGILIDWDLCKYKEDLTPDRPVSHGQRSGTWCFMSAVRTRFPRKEALVADDIESFMNLTLWFSVRFHKHDLGNDLHDHLETYYRGTTVSDQPVPIGKFDRYMRVKKADTRVPILHPRLNMIGNWLMMLCSQHYKTFTEGDLAMWGLPGCNISELNDADNDEIPFPTYGPPPMRTLDTHNLFIDVFRSELAKPKGWDPEDKLEDQFKKLVVERDQKPVTIGSFQPSTSTHSKRSCTAEPEGEPSTSRAPKRAKRGLRGVRTGSTPLGSHQESGENV